MKLRRDPRTIDAALIGLTWVAVRIAYSYGAIVRDLLGFDAPKYYHYNAQGWSVGLLLQIILTVVFLVTLRYRSLSTPLRIGAGFILGYWTCFLLMINGELYHLSGEIISGPK